MQPIIISPQAIKREIRFLATAFIMANLMNIYAIITYKTNWIELISSLHILIILSFFLYFIILLARLIIKLVVMVMNRIRH